MVSGRKSVDKYSMWYPHYENFFFPQPIGLAPIMTNRRFAPGTEFLLRRVRITFPISHLCIIGIFLNDCGTAINIDSNNIANIIVYDSPDMEIVLTPNLRVGVFLQFVVPPTSIQVSLYGLIRSKRKM